MPSSSTPLRLPPLSTSTQPCSYAVPKTGSTPTPQPPGTPPPPQHSPTASTKPGPSTTNTAHRPTPSSTAPTPTANDGSSWKATTSGHSPNIQKTPRLTTPTTSHGHKSAHTSSTPTASTPGRTGRKTRTGTADGCPNPEAHRPPTRRPPPPLGLARPRNRRPHRAPGDTATRRPADHHVPVRRRSQRRRPFRQQTPLHLRTLHRPLHRTPPAKTRRLPMGPRGHTPRRKLRRPPTGTRLRPRTPRAPGRLPDQQRPSPALDDPGRKTHHRRRPLLATRRPRPHAQLLRLLYLRRQEHQIGRSHRTNTSRRRRRANGSPIPNSRSKSALHSLRGLPKIKRPPKCSAPPRSTPPNSMPALPECTCTRFLGTTTPSPRRSAIASRGSSRCWTAA